MPHQVLAFATLIWRLAHAQGPFSGLHSPPSQPLGAGRQPWSGPVHTTVSDLGAPPGFGRPAVTTNSFPEGSSGHGASFIRAGGASAAAGVDAGSPATQAAPTQPKHAASEPEHYQLLRLSAELMQQGRFAEAKAALTAAAQMAGGGPEVMAYAEHLRWRMGLRRVSPAETDDWLGWRSFAREQPEPEWAEVPSSLPKAPATTQPQPRIGTEHQWSFLVWSVVIGAVPLSVAAVFVALQASAPRRVQEHPATQQPEAVRPPAPAPAPVAPPAAGVTSLAYPAPDPPLFLSDASSDGDKNDRTAGEVDQDEHPLDVGSSSSSEASPTRPQPLPGTAAGSTSPAFEEQDGGEEEEEEEEEDGPSAEPLAQVDEEGHDNEDDDEVTHDHQQSFFEQMHGLDEDGEEEEALEQPETPAYASACGSELVIVDGSQNGHGDLPEGKRPGEEQTPSGGGNNGPSDESPAAVDDDDADDEWEDVRGKSGEEEEDVIDEEAVDLDAVEVDGHEIDQRGAEYAEEPHVSHALSNDADRVGAVPLALQAQMVQIGGRTISLYELCQELGARTVEPPPSNPRERHQESNLGTVHECDELEEAEGAPERDSGEEEQAHEMEAGAQTELEMEEEEEEEDEEQEEEEEEEQEPGDQVWEDEDQWEGEESGEVLDGVRDDEPSHQYANEEEVLDEPAVVPMSGLPYWEDNEEWEEWEQWEQPQHAEGVRDDQRAANEEAMEEHMQDGEQWDQWEQTQRAEGEHADQEEENEEAEQEEELDHPDNEQWDQWAQTQRAEGEHADQEEENEEAEEEEEELEHPDDGYEQNSGDVACPYALQDAEQVLTNASEGVATPNAEVVLFDAEEDWGWGRQVGRTAEHEQALARERRRVSEAVAASWTPQAPAWNHEYGGDTRPRHLQPSSPPTRGKGKGRGASAAFKGSGRVAKASASSSSVAPSRSAEDEDAHTAAVDEGADEAAGPHAGGGQATSSRARYPSKAGKGANAEGADQASRAGGAKSRGGKPNMDDPEFVTARPVRFRPAGCYARLQGSGPEVWIGVEHMEPRVEANTAAIRDFVNAAGGRLRVRDLEDGTATMLSRRDMEKREQEIEARRRVIEDGIAWLRENYDTKKWLSGPISAVQATGIYVGIVEGKDAFCPIGEIPDKFLVQDDAEADEAGGEGAAQRPNFRIGETVDVRVVRHSWQTDSFLASMLSYEDSVARRRAAKGLPPPGARSSAPAARQLVVEEAPLEKPEHVSKDLERWAAKGFSVLSNAAARELSDYLKHNSEEKMIKASAKSSKAVGLKTEKKYIVNFARGMNPKVIGQITLPTKASDKEIKDAAVALAMKEGELKPGQDHKGVTIAKNIVTVKG